MFYKVYWSLKIDKKLEKLPNYIRDKFHYWVDLIERLGLIEVKKIQSFHDEALHGELKGLRSVRLNNAYRVIYLEHNAKFEIKNIEVLNVNKHEYKK